MGSTRDQFLAEFSQQEATRNPSAKEQFLADFSQGQPSASAKDRFLAEFSDQAQGPSPGLYGVEQQPNNPYVQQQQKMRTQRHIGNVLGAASNIRGAASAGDVDLARKSVSQLQGDLAARRQVEQGIPAPNSPKVDESGNRPLPGAIEKYLLAGTRALGALSAEKPAGYAQAIREANPGLPPEDVERRVAEMMRGGETDLAALAKAQRHALGSTLNYALDTEKPTLPEAMKANVERYGQTEKISHPRAALESFLAESHQHGLSIPGATSSFSLVNPATIRRIANWFSGEAEPEVKQLGGLTPDGAAIAGGVTSMFADPLPVVAGTAVRGAGLVGKQAMKVAGVANKALEKAVPAAANFNRAAQPTLDRAEEYVRGAPAFMAHIERAGKDAGVAGPDAAAMTRAAGQIEPKTIMALQDVESVVDKVKRGVGPAEIEDFHRAVELNGMRADLAYQRLSPQAREAVDAAKDLMAKQGAEGQKHLNLALREDYGVGHSLTQEAKESAKRGGMGVPLPGAKPPSAGGHFKQRTLPDMLTAEAGQKVTTSPEVNAFIKNNPNSPTAKALEQNYPSLQKGGKLMEEDPAKLIAKRGIAGSQENAWGEFLKGNFKQYAEKLAPGAKPRAGYVRAGDLKNSIVTRALGEDTAIPEPMFRFLQRAHKEPGKLDKVMGVWKFMVTAGAGPAYHVRNNLYSASKATEEYGPSVLKSLAEADAIRSGRQGTIAGKSYKDIEAMGAVYRAARGTSGSASAKAKDIAIKAGVEKTNFPTFRKVPQAAGKLAAGSDETWRMAVAIEEAKRNGGNWAQAFDKASKFVVHTGDASPLLDDLSQLMPFIKWSGKEAPSALAHAAAGKARLPYIAKNVQEARAPTDTQIPESERDERNREQASFPIGKKSEAGLPFYAYQPHAMGAVLSGVPGIASVHSLAQGDVKGAGKNLIDPVIEQMAPAQRLALEMFTGQRSITNIPMDMPIKANPVSEMVERSGVDVPWVKQRGEGDAVRFEEPAGVSAAMSFIPYQQFMRAFLARTPEERARYMSSLLGAGVAPVDMTFQQTSDRVGTGGEVRAAKGSFKKDLRIGPAR